MFKNAKSLLLTVSVLKLLPKPKKKKKIPRKICPTLTKFSTNKKRRLKMAIRLTKKKCSVVQSPKRRKLRKLLMNKSRITLQKMKKTVAR